MQTLNRYFAAVALTVAVGGAISVAADPADRYPNLHLIPWPKSLQSDGGSMRLSAESRIVAETEILQPLAQVLSDEIASLSGMTLKVTSGPGRPRDIVLKLNPQIQADDRILVLRNREPVRTQDGAHVVTVNEQAVVEGFDYRAVAEGTSSILQLLGKTEEGYFLPRVSIKDWPHADYCGVMLDVGRQDHPIAAIKQVVKLCRFYKARYLQLHLTDDQGWTFPSIKYPQLGSKNYGAHGGIAPRVYGLDELKELVAFADARGVTLVPEMEVPGHSGAALRSLPEIFDAINPQSGQPVGMGCMNMSNEEIYPALETIIGEMCVVFQSSPYFHIGSDEVTSGRLSLHPGYQAFMKKHGLADDHQLANHFIAAVCEMVKKQGKKAIKWEGLANTATEDVIIMAWEANSTAATEMLARGYTTITCPWNLEVPWEEWNMYVCNASRLKRGDLVLGATLVAWEQPPLTHVTNLRNLASRQERTWGPDNSVTVEGFAVRFQPLDVVAGKLIGMPPKPQWQATATATLGVGDFLEPVFAFDGNDATFYKSARIPQTGDHFTLTFEQPQSVHAIEILTGANRHGQLNDGDVQVSGNGEDFTTIAKLRDGSAKATLANHQVRAIRLRAVAAQQEPLVIRAIKLRMLVPVSGVVSNPNAVVGEGNVAATEGNARFDYPIGACAVPVINRDSTLTLDNGGNPCNYSGPISGSGTVEISAGKESGPFVLDGKFANTMQGTWSIKAGRVVLAKEAGTDALAGTIVVGNPKSQAALVWNSHHQIQDQATIQLLTSDSGVTSLNLNGYSETFASLTLAGGTKVLTDGAQGSGVLTVQSLTVGGQRLPQGIYASPKLWLEGNGYVVVGDVKRADVSGVVADPNTSIGKDRLAVLKAASTFVLSDGECAVAADLGAFPLTLTASKGKAGFSGFMTGKGSLNLESVGDQPLELLGSTSNSYQGIATLSRGILKLSKTNNAIAIPGDLTLSAANGEKEVAVVWNGDGQISSSATVIVEGSLPAILDLNQHAVLLSKVLLTKSAKIRTSKAGRLQVKQLFVDGRRLKDGDYQGPQSWLEGAGTVQVDARVDIQGVIGSPEVAIGLGNIGNLTGDTKIGYPSGGGDFEIATNGFTLTLDSGDGNAFAYSGPISGTGNVAFYMGPSYTGYRDAPLRLAGEKPNTTSGSFLVKKGRVQLEKPEGVDAISGDVIVGGQGFNDCLFWKSSHQLRDTVHITLIDAGNNGAAYLHLNGCREAAAGLTMTVNNKILTDSADGNRGELVVKSLVIGGVTKAAGIYRASEETWLEGQGTVIVRP